MPLSTALNHAYTVVAAQVLTSCKDQSTKRNECKFKKQRNEFQIVVALSRVRHTWTHVVGQRKDRKL